GSSVLSARRLWCHRRGWRRLRCGLLRRLCRRCLWGGRLRSRRRRLPGSGLLLRRWRGRGGLLGPRARRHNYEQQGTPIGTALDHSLVLCGVSRILAGGSLLLLTVPDRVLDLVELSFLSLPLGTPKRPGPLEADSVAIFDSGGRVNQPGVFVLL